MRIALLGATGQIGKVIHQQLLKDYPESEVIACSRANRKGYFQFDPFKDDWQKLGLVNVLINSVGIIKESGDMTFEKVHEGLTRLILQNREQLGYPRIIQLSALGADANSHINFFSTKGKADELLLHEPETLVIRPSIVCTPNTNMAQKLKMLSNIARFTFGVMPFPSGFRNTRIQPVMGEDVAATIANCCTQNTGSRVIAVAGPEVFTINEVLNIVAHRKIRLVDVPLWLTGPALGLISGIAPSLISKAEYELLRRDNVADNTEACRILGREMQGTRGFWAEVKE